MKRYPDHLVRQARRLFISEGLDFKGVAQKLRVDSRAVSLWCRELIPNNRWRGLIASNQAKRDLLRNSESHIVQKIELKKDLAKLFCALLYGCEGSKYPAHSGVAFVNSDPNLIATFVNLARSSFHLNKNRWRVQLQIHSDQNYPKLVAYWSQLLKIPKHNFQKPTITSPRGGKHRNEYYGTCSARYNDYKIQLKLIGIFEEFMRKFALQGEVA